MNRHSILSSSLLSLSLLLAASAARAQTRTWVSGVGNDANPCSRTAPCKTFAAAYSTTSAGGEISVIDAGGYGPVVITKAITISGDGSLAGILASGLNGIVVNAGKEDRVVLRNLSIHGDSEGSSGVRYISGKSLTLDGVTIEGFKDHGVIMDVTAQAKLFVRNTRITAAATGVYLNSNDEGMAQAMLEGVHLTGLGNGIEAAANARAVVTDSVLSGNTKNGALASAATSRLFLEGCQIAFNDTAGINAFGNGSVVRISNNEIYSNANGISISAGASVDSTKDNRVEENGPSSPPSGSITVE